MRICGRQFLLLALAPFVLAACGGTGDGESGGPSGNNLPPIIQGSPATTLSAGSNYSFTPIAADPDGDTLTFSASNLPGWAKIDAASGAVNGTPTESDVGMSGAIVIEVTDSKAVAQLAPFRIQVASNSTVAPPNSAPTIAGRPAESATVGRLYTFTPVGDDVDNNDLSYSIENKPTWATFTPATGELRGTPATSNIGTTIDVTITVSDGDKTATLTPFDLQVVATAAVPNRAPTITGTPGRTATVGRTYSFRAVGSDADGDSLTYSIQNRPSWATFSTTTGQLTGTPTSGSVGTSARITISVSDGEAPLVSLASFTIQVSAQANRAPTISGSPLLSTTVGTLFSFTPTASDPDGNTLSFSVTNLPPWATFNTSTGRISGTPALLNIGNFAGIVISVSDGTASASLPAFTLGVLQIGTGTATVNWNPPTENSDGTPLNDLRGFRVVWGRSATTLTQSVTLNNAGLTSHMVTSLASGQWFFAVRARNSAGVESDISNVASKTIP
jgi:hypothetical protein